MARRKKQPTSTLNGARTHYEGLGYYVPSGYTLEQVVQTASEWNDKLQKSGHIDIESFSDCLPGLSSPYLLNSRSYKSLQSHYDPSAALSYVRTYIEYYMYTEPAKLHYGERYKSSIFLLECYVNQVVYRDISKLAASKDLQVFVTKHKNVEIAEDFSTECLKSSHYWAFQNTREALQHCWLWHITDVNGELESEDLMSYELMGLNVKGTLEYYNTELKKLDLPQINLKMKPCKY